MVPVQHQSYYVIKGRNGGRHYRYNLGAQRVLIIEGLAGDSRIEALDDLET